MKSGQGMGKPRVGWIVGDERSEEKRIAAWNACCRQDTDDRMRDLIENDGAIEHLGVAPEARLPHPVGKYHRAIFSPGEIGTGSRNRGR